MLACLLILCSGYGFGYEGYDNGKLYFGLYSFNVEYGYVLTEKELYLNTVWYSD